MPLPKPPNWPLPDRRRQFRVAVVLGTFFAVAGVFFTVSGAMEPWLPLGHVVFWAAVADVARPARLGAVTRGGALVLKASRRRIVAVVGGSGALCLGAALELGWPLGLAVVAMYAVAMVVIARRGLGGEIALDPEGIEFAVPSFHRRVPWGDVGRVSMGRNGRLLVAAPGEGVWVRSEAYAGDPLVLYWTLHHYATHPESRPELADERAVERVRREDLA